MGIFDAGLGTHDKMQIHKDIETPGIPAADATPSVCFREGRQRSNRNRSRRRSDNMTPYLPTRCQSQRRHGQRITGNPREDIRQSRSARKPPVMTAPTAASKWPKRITVDPRQKRYRGRATKAGSGYNRFPEQRKRNLWSTRLRRKQAD